MAYAFRNASTNGGATGGALTVTAPTGLTDGDLIVVVGYLETDTNSWASVGSGFTSAGTFVNTGAFLMQVWWKIAASEGASWTWTPTSSAWRTVVAVAYSGATGSGSTRVDQFGTASQGDSITSSTVNGVTTTVTNDVLLAAAGSFNGQSWSYTSGPASNSRANFAGVAYLDNPTQASGATGNTVLGVTTSDSLAANHVAFFLDASAGGGSGTPPRGIVTAPAYRRG